MTIMCPHCAVELECTADDLRQKALQCPSCNQNFGVEMRGEIVKTYAIDSNVDVKNHMIGAILSTVFCCLIGGIISIVYASKVNTKLAQGDVVGAKAASKTAKRWIIANVLFAPLIGLICIVTSALLPAVSNAQQSTTSSAVTMRGRNLFFAMSRADAEREAAGLPSVWPHTVGSDDLSDDGEDIAGKLFGNSTDYFRVLFDMASCGTDNWAPYVCVDLSVLKLSKESDFCDWIIAANVKSEFDNVIPVLISANVDPRVLITSFSGDDDAIIPFGSKVGRTKLPWCDDFVVVVRKDGSSQVFKPNEFTYSKLYNGHAFVACGLKYLDVE